MRARLIDHKSPREFLAAINDRIAGREAELNLMLGVAESGQEGFYATTAGSDGPHAVVMRTPPRGFFVAELVGGAAVELASLLLERGLHRDAPRVIGSKPCSQVFAKHWAQGVGAVTRLELAQRILALTNVDHPRTSPPGTLRRAYSNDEDLLAEWFRQFADDALSPQEAAATDWRARSRELVQREQVFLWEVHGRPVSMACLVRPAGGGIGVTFVYTPREERGRGFASACVAALSQYALDAGHRFCCLYTNAANPTSNRIYERIGFRVVAESEVWAFDC